jgi:hypothetical protein
MWQTDPSMRALMRDGSGPGHEAGLFLAWLYKRFMVTLGGTLIVIAVPIGILTPVIPVGLPLAVVGLLILLNHSRSAKRMFVRWSKRHPITSKRLRVFLRRKRA